MRIEIDTKYGIGQKVYVVDHGYTVERFVREARIRGIGAYRGDDGGKPKECVFYFLTPQWLIGRDRAMECDVYATEGEAQAGADRINGLFAKEGKNR